MKKSLVSLLMLLVAAVAFAQPVAWSFKLVGDKTESPSVKITATVAPGFHLYSQDNPDGGGVPLQFFVDTKGCKAVGKPTADKAYQKAFSDIFETNEHFYTGTVTFTQKLKATDKNFSVNIELKGQACNDSGCMPLHAQHSFSGTAPV